MSDHNQEAEHAALELAPCPFCGNCHMLYVEHVAGTVIHPAYFVRCDNCGAVGPTTDKGDHIEEWNRRSPAVGEDGLPPLPAQQEELQSRWKCEDCDGRGYTGKWTDQGYFQTPEPERCGTCNGNGSVAIHAYTAEQYRQGQRETVAILRMSFDAAMSLAGETINARNAEVADLRAQLALKSQEGVVTPEDAIAFGASLLGFASETDSLEGYEAIEWARSRWQEWGKR